MLEVLYYEYISSWVGKFKKLGCAQHNLESFM